MLLGRDETFLVNDVTTGAQSTSETAALPGGGFVSVWGSDGTTRARIFDGNGVPTGAAFEVTGASSDFDVTTLGDGTIVIVWRAGSAVDMAQFTSTGTQIGSTTEVVSSAGKSLSQPAITTLANGQFAVSWTERASPADADGAEIYGRVFNASGTPATAPVFFNFNSGGDQISSDIAALSGGGFVATWLSGQSVRAAVFDSAGTPSSTNSPSSPIRDLRPA